MAKGKWAKVARLSVGSWQFFFFGKNRPFYVAYCELLMCLCGKNQKASWQAFSWQFAVRFAHLAVKQKASWQKANLQEFAVFQLAVRFAHLAVKIKRQVGKKQVGKSLQAFSWQLAARFATLAKSFATLAVKTKGKLARVYRLSVGSWQFALRTWR